VANLKTYKFVNPGVAASASPAVAAARTQTMALNRLGATVSSIGTLVSDIEKISIAQIKNDKARIQAERRAERRKLDTAAEESVEAKKAGADKNSELAKNTEKRIKGRKNPFGWLQTFLGPIGSALLAVGGFALTQETLKWLGDEENTKKITEFLDKAGFVFNKLKEFAENISKAIGEGLDNVFGKEKTIEERLNAFGKIAMAIGGIAGLIAAAGGINDLLDAGDDLDSTRPRGDGPDAKPRKPAKPTPTNPSGANPEFEGPRGRPPVSDIANTYGEAAARQYKKILAEYGDDAARAYSNALLNSGGDASKALKAWKRLKLSPLPKPKPNALQKISGFFQGVAEGAAKQGQRLGTWAYDQSGKLVKSLQGLPGWAVQQYNNMSAAARKKWDDVVKVGQKVKQRGMAIATAAGDKFKAAGNWIADGGKSFLNNASAAAKNFFMEKIVAPLKPIIDPVAKTASKIGQALFDALMKIPGADKILGVLKKAGIGSMGDIATAGGKLGKRAAAVLPIIGGIVNLLFAYDRAANGDSIGALIEGTSGILDIAGLATAGAGNVASMMLDGYMFARDFIPQLQQGEEAVVDAVGARGLKTQIDAILSKLPNLGELVGKITQLFGGGNYEDTEGNSPDAHQEQQLFLGGVVKNIGNAIGGAANAVGGAISGVMSSPVGQVLGTAASFIPGAAPIMAGINTLATGNPMSMLGMIPGVSSFMSGPIGNIASNLMSGNFGQALGTGISMINPAVGQLASSMFSGGFNPMSMMGSVASQFGMSGLYNAVTGAMGGDYNAGVRELGAQIGVNPIILGAVEGVTSKAMSKDGLSAEYAMQQALEFVPVPMVLEKLVPLPTPVPINTGGAGVVTGVPSSLTQRTQ